jgi:Fe-S-cluster containining protein
VFAADLARMAPATQAFTERLGQDRVIPMREGCCAALDVDAAQQSYRCRIYPERPDCCRWLQPGSGLCLQLRAALPSG